MQIAKKYKKNEVSLNFKFKSANFNATGRIFLRQQGE